MPGKVPTPTHTPLAALPAMVLDLEATGLDVRNDRIVQAAAIRLCDSLKHFAKTLCSPLQTSCMSDS